MPVSDLFEEYRFTIKFEIRILGFPGSFFFIKCCVGIQNSFTFLMSIRTGFSISAKMSLGFCSDSFKSVDHFW
jgi:hypothetical protein